MNYLDDIEKELRELLAQEPKYKAPKGNEEYEEAVEDLAERYLEWEDKVLKLLKTKVLESFKNGAATERKRSQNPNRNPNKKSKASK